MPREHTGHFAICPYGGPPLPVPERQRLPLKAGDGGNDRHTVALLPSCLEGWGATDERMTAIQAALLEAWLSSRCIVRSPSTVPAIVTATVSAQPTLPFRAKLCHLRRSQGGGKPRQRRGMYDLR